MKKLMGLILVWLIMLGCFAGCTPSATQTPTGEPTVQPTAEPTAEPTPTPVEEFTISDFVIIYPEVKLGIGYETEETAFDLCDAIENATSAECGLLNDELDEDNGLTESKYEILLGDTNRVQSDCAEELKYNDYIIKFVDTKLVIAGGSDAATAAAAEYFVNNMLKADWNTVEGCKQIAEVNYLYVHDTNIGRLSIAGHYITDFRVFAAQGEDTTTDFINRVLENAGEKLQAVPKNAVKDFEILIGECDRDEYRQVVADMRDRDYAIEVVGNKLVIAGKTDRGTELALETFYREYLGKKTETLDINEDTDYRYAHLYPISEMKLCGHDISDFVIVASDNNLGVAQKLNKLLEQMTGEKVQVVTDGAQRYDAAIVLSKSGDENVSRLLEAIGSDKAIIKSEGSKIYLGSGSMSYGDSPAVNAFVKDVLGYDVYLGVAKNDTVNIESIDNTLEIEAYLEDFIITQYHGIRESYVINEDGTLNKAVIDENAAAGMNLIDIGFELEINQMVLEYCHEIGIRCTVYDKRLQNLVWAESLPEGWEETVKQVVEDYSAYPAMMYYGLTDEPEPTEYRFNIIRRVANLLEELDPARSQYVNHFPQWSPDMYRLYMDIVDPEILSYDRYVFHKDIEDGLDAFFINLECARTAALEHNAKYMAILLLIEHWNTESGGQTHYRYLYEEELKWQAYHALAYGVSEVSYFTYWSPSNYTWVFGDGMIDINGNKTQHYYDVQNLMKDFKKIANVLVDKTSLGVYHLTENYDIEGNTTVPFEGFGTIEDVIAKDATIGMFEDDMMMIVNKSYKEKCDVEIVTDSTLLLYDPATGNWNELEDKKLTLNEGEGELIKIMK